MSKICCYSNCNNSVFDMRTLMCEVHYKDFIKDDVINKPKHYHECGVDPISIGEKIFSKEEMNGFYKMNMLKYWYRAGKKEGNSKEQDLEKYNFYKKKLEENK